MTTELIQRRYTEMSIEHTISKMENTIVNLNIELILKDIEKFENALLKAKNKYNRQNLKAIIAYLRKLVKTLKDDLSLELSWDIDTKTGFPVSYPIQLVCENVYNVNVCNYIEVSQESKFVDIDLSSLTSAIALEIMWKDLGETYESIEDELKDCGVTTVEDISILDNYVKKLSSKSLYELSKTYRIDDSAYCIRESEEIEDYFGTKSFEATTYRDVIKHSCLYANCVILSNICKEANRTKSELRLLSIDANRIQFEVKGCSDKNIREILVGDIVVRILGRKFKLSNYITIY